MPLQRFVGPWPLLQFRNVFYTDGRTPWTGISPSQGRYLHIKQHKHRINAHTDIHVLSGIRTHNPRVRASEDSSCLRSRKNRGQIYMYNLYINYCRKALGHAVTFMLRGKWIYLTHDMVQLRRYVWPPQRNFPHRLMFMSLPFMYNDWSMKTVLISSD
jgi:hypothetical protein